MGNIFVGSNQVKKIYKGSTLLAEVKEEQTKTVSVTQNGQTTVTPDSGKTLSSVTINTSVSGGGVPVGNAVWYWQNGQSAPVQVTGISWNSSTGYFEKTINNNVNDIVMVTNDGNPPAQDLSNICIFYQCVRISGSFTTLIACPFTDGTHSGAIYLTV